MARRSKIQLGLAFGEGAKGEARSARAGGIEADAASAADQSPAAFAGPCMEAIVERDNLRKALAQVQRNKGAAGIDGMSVEALSAHLNDHWPTIRARLLDGSYAPQPVRRVEIPKASGGVRALGVPTVLDRFIQQAALQVLQAHWDGTFSASSYGFRPGRSAHQAVSAAQALIASGRRVVADLDIEKFFDRVNHDILMGLVAKRVADPRILKLIRGFLTCGALMDGLVGPTDEGTPQGGPLSPLLSNLMLDVLDKELERRGHRFVRYADDCNIYVCSQRAGERVMAGVERFLERRLKLKVNGLRARSRRRRGASSSGSASRAGQRRNAASLRRRWPASRNGCARRRSGRREQVSKRSSKTYRATSSVGAVISASARRLRRCAFLTGGSGEGFDPSSGSNGSVGRPALRNCAAAAWATIWRRKPPAVPTAPGGSATAQRSPSRFQTTSSANPSALPPSPPEKAA